MADAWQIELCGGAFHGCRGEDDTAHDVLIVWGDKAEMRATPYAANPEIVLKTAQAYRLSELFEDEGRAVYEVGEDAPRPTLVERVYEYIGPSCRRPA